ncbi:hypothetical protein JMN32_23260 [Fulvivirga sp. 29W222]|uniref:CHRD domain-containing protein n=1 Tax=Fulvivirga marina TaxID=2494733 RepID=A0A937G2F5_9BACT|nr:hypothetical protein [Fulvivirga marina]MBL6449248.1 hypothetical protein [Fulvivirga marina]
MKNTLYAFLLMTSVIIASCSDDDQAENTLFTGREVTYNLLQGSDFPVYGTVTFKERKDLSLQAVVKLEGTEGDAVHPAHMHYGDISNPDAEMALPLNDLSAKTGESLTLITKLMDETPFGYDDMMTFGGSVKVHLAATGDGKSVVLAGGNIGEDTKASSISGRVKIAVCKSE